MLFSLIVVLVGIDLISDHAADGRAADRADRTTTGKDSATGRADPRTYGRVLILLRHPGAPSESEQQRQRYSGEPWVLVH
jgi:hypothetical protein